MLILRIPSLYLLLTYTLQAYHTTIYTVVQLAMALKM